MKLDAKHIQTKLRAARDAAGLTQAKLAKLAGTTQPDIARLEKGRRDNPPTQRLVAICNALKIGADHLLTK